VMRRVVVYEDLEDGGWVAEVPSLPGCVSQGESKETALTNVEDAMADWIAAAQHDGRPIPDDDGLGSEK
jgi:predicted RNase H-like HicB family nuclease